jgi:dihydroxyacid dehydratase/phosphogluconate dehydratase
VPRVGILNPAVSGYADFVREAGGEPASLSLPIARPAGGVALHREWIADCVQILSSGQNLDALLVGAAEPAELAGLLLAALRLDLPVVLAAPLTHPFTVALAALGFAPLTRNPVEVAVDAARVGGSRPDELVEGFALANALRAGLLLGAGPELLVHLAAIAREGGTPGFSQIVRAIAPDNPAVTTTRSPWFEAHGAAGLFAHLGDALHDVPTVEGRLKDALPPAPPAPEETGSRLVFVLGRASGTEVLCRVNEADTEVSGSCRFCVSEEAAVQTVVNGAVEPSDLLVVGGCGPRGGPGLIRLDRLARTLDDAGLAVPVLTDGLSPEEATGIWASLATPETATGGVIARLRDGDLLRLDLVKGLIRTAVKAKELDRREPLALSASAGFSYAARYSRLALTALEGAGFV